jgi:hypothetical protein
MAGQQLQSCRYLESCRYRESCRYLAAACTLALAVLAPGLISAAPHTDPQAPARPVAHAAGLNQPPKRSTLSAASVPRTALRVNPPAKTAPRFAPGRTTAPGVVGGPARFNAAKGGAIGGTLMRRKP